MVRHDKGGATVPHTEEARRRATDAIEQAIAAAADGRNPVPDPAIAETARDLELRAWALLDPGNLRATSPHAPVLVDRTSGATGESS